METRKSLLLSAGAIAIAALLAATDAFAQLSCTSRTTGENPGTFTVTVNPVTQSGRTIYTYTVTGANANKLFIFVKKGLGTNLVSLRNSSPGGTYLTPHTTDGGFPPLDTWRAVHHQDAVNFNNIAIGNTFTLDVPERYKPEEGLTTVLLGIKSTFEHCGPILGPTTPEAPTFPGSPLVQTVSAKTFANGCIYDVVADETGGNILAMALNANSPSTETVCGIGGCKPCAVVTAPNICETETGFPFCPPLKLGQPPIQSQPGGTCYYPRNIKFTC